MPNRRYQKGYRYELKCKRQLEAEGWTVLRTAGSHGDADLVGYMGGIWKYPVGHAEQKTWIKLPKVIFVQCKVSPTKADREKIDKLRRDTGLDWRLL